MKIKNWLKVVFVFVVFVFPNTSIFSQNTNNSGNANPVVVTNMPDTSYVNHRFRIEGTSNLTPNEHIWVLIRNQDFFPEWWPQNQVRVNSNGSWNVKAYFGGEDNENDIGAYFDVVILVVNESEHAKLVQYRQECKQNEKWPSIDTEPPSIFRIEKVALRQK